MAKVPDGFFIPQRGAGMRGVMVAAQGPGGLYARKWPKKRGPARSAAQQQSQDVWAYCIEALKWMDPLTLAFAREVSTHVPLLPRDLAMMQLLGNPFYIELPEGRRIFSMAAMQDVSLLLDTIYQTKGGILYRDNSLWKGLAAGGADEVLTMGTDGVPIWQGSSGGGGVTVLATGTVAFGPTFDIDFSNWMAGYPEIEIHLENLKSSVSGSDIGLRFGIGPPITWISTSNCVNWGHSRVEGNSNAGSVGMNDNIINLTNGRAVDMGSGKGYSAVLHSSNWTVASDYPKWRYDGWYDGDSGVIVRNMGAARFNQLHPTVAMQLFLGSGNWLSGSWKVVGYG